MQLLVYSLMLMAAFISRTECERNTQRSTRASRSDAIAGFECPDEFGYYPHPRDCTQYYVCVFGGALLESCTGGLMYSHELQTCDWPRNVGCQSDAVSIQETEDDDPLLERSTKVESQRQQQRQQQQQQQQRQPVQRQQVHVTSPSPSITQITERQSRHRQHHHQQQQQQSSQSAYQDQDDEYEPATEFENDRQQRVYRGQPSTIGQVQRDRDGLRRNIISVSSTHPSHPASIITTPPSHGDDSVGHETNANLTTTLSPTTTRSTINDQLPDNNDYTINEATKRNYVVVSSPSPFKLPPKENYNYHVRVRDQTKNIDLSSTTPTIKNDDEQQTNRVLNAIVSPPAPSKLPILEQRIDRGQTTQSSSVNDELEHNEISASTPATRKQQTTYEFDNDEPIGRGNYFTAPSTVRQRIQARIAQRGHERYYGSNYVTMMKVVRKRPIDRDQIGKDSFASDVTLPYRGTTSQTPVAVPVGGQKNVLPSPRNNKTPERVGQVDDAPTTLSPSMRAAILSQFQRDQEDVEKNEISVQNSRNRNTIINEKNDISNRISASSFPPALKSHVELIKSEMAITTPTPFRHAPSLSSSSSSPSPSSSSSSSSPDEIEKNEISVTSLTTPKQSSVNHKQNQLEKKDSSNVIAGPVNSRQRQRDSSRRSSTLEREKESLVNSARMQTESHFRSIPSETLRTVKTTTSTPVISKAYYDPESYPYYTIYDDDVSIYKDDDYTQYTINQSVPIHHQPPQQQNVRIAEVTPNSKTYSQKPKKVAVNDADKYNFNSGVTASDYDIYENQGHLNKNKFHINDGQQSYRTNGLNPLIHVTTPNAIVDAYVPLTTSTQSPPTTTARPFTVTVQSRGRPQVNRGTAPPRLRPTLKPSTEIVSKAQEFIDIYRYPPVRPASIYPTPVVDKSAAKCRKDVCLLPDCNCGGADIPGDYLPEEIPQIVLLTFDDSVNDLNKVLYADLFEKGRKNPNGCPISATFYVSHEWTDYSQVQNLYASGHEIASHTVSHSFGEQFSAKKWAREVAGQREILAAYGGVKLEDVRGMRAPFLSVGGNNMFKMLWETNFTYDSSMPIYENRPPSWPYTLDYKLFHDCMIPPCPTKSYPGLWEVPMVMWQDLNGGRCSMGDACSNPPTSDGVYKMLIKNFERHYTTNRAPFGLFYHAAWFTQPHHKEGFISFLDTIVAMDDVWVVTNWQALQWVRNPTPLGLLNNFDGFACNYPDRPKKCNNSKLCNLWHKSGVRYMRTCQPCPDIYPWTGKTGIRSSRFDNDIEN